MTSGFRASVIDVVEFGLIIRRDIVAIMPQVSYSGATGANLFAVSIAGREVLCVKSWVVILSSSFIILRTSYSA